MHANNYRRWLLAASGLVVAAAFGAAGCQGTSGELSSGINLGSGTTASINEGGKLYDDWLKIAGDTKTGGTDATTTNAYYSANGVGSKTLGESWRCKACHGWDYQSFGLFAARTENAETLFFAIKDGRGTAPGAKSHAFGQWLSDDQIADLVKFIREGLIDTSLVIDSSSSKAIGVAADGKTKFNSICATCHDATGRKINFHGGTQGAKQGDSAHKYESEFIETIATENPWEILHKMRMGQPGEQMPAASDNNLSLEDVANILAWAQTLGSPDGTITVDSKTYNMQLASAIRGGALYDKWWEINGNVATPTSTKNELYTALGGTAGNEKSWRCLTCHGVDYGTQFTSSALGNQLFGINASTTEIITAIALGTGGGLNAHSPTSSSATGHAFLAANLLSEEDIANLALFIQEKLNGQKAGGVSDDPTVDNDKVIDRDRGLSFASAASGKAQFLNKCSFCHGETGTDINFHHHDPVTATEAPAEYIGTIAEEDAYELAQKIRFGQPGSDGHDEGYMPNGLDNGFTEDDVKNIIAYARTFPTSVERGGQAWDNWWETIGIDAPGTGSSTLAATNPFYAGESVSSTAPNTKNFRSGTDTWRCKECHGWDYKGSNGQYATGGHATGFKGMLKADGTADVTTTASELFNAIYSGDLNHDATNDDMATSSMSFTRYGSTSTTVAAYAGAHSFGEAIKAGWMAKNPKLEEEEAEEFGGNVVRDMVNFILNASKAPSDQSIGGMTNLADGILDITSTTSDPFVAGASYVVWENGEDIGSTPQPGARTRKAIELWGQQKYNDVCATCHGFDGRRINFHAGNNEPAEYVGTIARENPWELLNKILHGQPATSDNVAPGRMPHAGANGWTQDDIADLLKFMQQNLPGS